MRLRLLLFAIFQSLCVSLAWAEMTVSISGCPCVGGPVWVNMVPNLCNQSGSSLTLVGWRFKTPSYNGYTSTGGPAATISGSGPYQYQQLVSNWDQIRPVNSCLNTYSYSGNPIAAGQDGTPYDFQFLIKTGSCNPPAPYATPTPLPCSQISSLTASPSYYSTACIPSSLGQYGGPDSGGFINTFLNQTQIQVGLPSNPWTISNTNVIFDPTTMGGPLYMMASAMAQEYLSIDMRFMFGIGAKESFAAMRQVPGGALFIPTNASGVNGTYHVEVWTLGRVIMSYPNFFPRHACSATAPDVTTANSYSCVSADGGWPGVGNWYMCTAGNSCPYIGSNSAQLVNSVFASGLNMWWIYDALSLSTNLCFKTLLEQGHDPQAALKIIAPAYNLGINSGFESGILPPGAGQLAATDITPYVPTGNGNYMPEVMLTANQIANASACGGNAIYDANISLADLQTFFFGNGGTAAAPTDGGLWAHFSNLYSSAATRSALWADVVCAFNQLAAHWGGTHISYRYDFLTILRVARNYLNLNRPFPTQSDFTSWVNSRSTNATACGTTVETTFPQLTLSSPAQNATVCPPFTVQFNSTDNNSVAKAEWTLDPTWLTWNQATGGGPNYQFTVPLGAPNLPLSGPGKLWVRSTNPCGNTTLQELDFNVNCGLPTPTPSNSPTATWSSTPTFTRSSSPTVTPSVSPSHSSSATPCVTPSHTATLSVSPSFTSSFSPTRSGTPTASPSATPSFTQTVTLTATPSFTASPTRTNTSLNTTTDTPTNSPSSTATPTATPRSTVTDSPSATPSFTASPTRANTLLNTATDTPTSSATYTASPSATSSFTQTVTLTATPSFSATPTYSSTGSPSNTLTASPSSTSSPSFSFTPTATASATPSMSFTPSFSPRSSSTLTSSPSSSPSFTPSFSFTQSESLSATPSISPSSTNSPVFSATASPSATDSYTSSATATISPTASASPSSTPTSTQTPSNSPSPSATLTASPSFSFTFTATYSATPSFTPSFSVSPSASPTPSRTSTPSASPSNTPSPYVPPTATFSPRVFTFDLAVYNSSGERVRTLVTNQASGLSPDDWTVLNGLINPGQTQAQMKAGGRLYTFDGKNDSGQWLPPGIYLVRLASKDPWGHVETYSANLNLLPPAREVDISIYSSSGELVRRLDLSTSASNTGTVSLSSGVLLLGNGQLLNIQAFGFNSNWDGRDARGQWVESGIYEIKFEEMDEMGQEIDSARVQVLRAPAQISSAPQIAPQPLRANATLELSWGQADFGAEIYNLAGERVREAKGSNGRLSLTWQSTAGIYILVLRDQAGYIWKTKVAVAP